jgi:uncharacterized protein YjbI with pentapeptide repeats
MKTQRRRLISFLWKPLFNGWVIGFAVSILVGLTLIFSSKLSGWLANSTFLKALDSLSKLSVLVAIVAFLRQIPRWKVQEQEEAKKRRFDYWRAIDAANVARASSRYGRFSSHALKIALENLAQEKDKKGKPFKIGPFDVSGADLTEINLNNAYLYIAGFRGTNLSGAIFTRTIFENVYFQRARLFGADFREATFRNGAVFRHALYDDATKFPDGFDQVIARAYRIAPKSDLRGAMLVQAMLWDAQLEEADLREADIREAMIGGNLSRAQLQNANLSGAKLGDANLLSANLQNAILQETGFHRAVLRNANLRNADLQDAIFEDADLAEADFRQARNLTVEQIKAAKNWEQAIFDDDFLVSNNSGLQLGAV